MPSVDLNIVCSAQYIGDEIVSFVMTKVTDIPIQTS
jgi:hypothetical protein